MLYIIKMYNNKSCTAKKSKKNPNAYTKEELVKLAISKGISKTKAQKNTKEEICKILNNLNSSKKIS